MIYLKEGWWGSKKPRDHVDFKRLPATRWKYHQNFRRKTINQYGHRWSDIQISRYCKVFRHTSEQAHVVFL